MSSYENEIKEAKDWKQSTEEKNKIQDKKLKEKDIEIKTLQEKNSQNTEKINFLVKELENRNNAANELKLENQIYNENFKNLENEFLLITKNYETLKDNSVKNKVKKIQLYSF